MLSLNKIPKCIYKDQYPYASSTYDNRGAIAYKTVSLKTMPQKLSPKSYQKQQFSPAVHTHSPVNTQLLEPVFQRYCNTGTQGTTICIVSIYSLYCHSLNGLPTRPTLHPKACPYPNTYKLTYTIPMMHLFPCNHCRKQKLCTRSCYADLPTCTSHSKVARTEVPP